MALMPDQTLGPSYFLLEQIFCLLMVDSLDLCGQLAPDWLPLVGALL